MTPNTLVVEVRSMLDGMLKLLGSPRSELKTLAAEDILLRHGVLEHFRRGSPRFDR